MKTVCDLPRLTKESVLILGSGPSLLNCPSETLQRHVTIAINRACLYRTPTIAMIADDNECKKIGASIPLDTRYVVTQYAGASYLTSVPAEKIHLFRWAMNGIDEVTPDNDLLYYRETTAIGAIVLCWKLGAADIYLVGVDAHHLRFRPEEGILATASYFYDPMFTHPEILQEPRENCWATAIDRVVETWTPGRCKVWQTSVYASTKKVPYFPIGEL